MTRIEATSRAWRREIQALCPIRRPTGQPHPSPDNASGLAVAAPRRTEWVPALCTGRTPGATSAGLTIVSLVREGTCASSRLATGAVLASSGPASCHRSQGGEALPSPRAWRPTPPRGIGTQGRFAARTEPRPPGRRSGDGFAVPQKWFIREVESLPCVEAESVLPSSAGPGGVNRSECAAEATGVDRGGVGSRQGTP